MYLQILCDILLTVTVARCGVYARTGSLVAPVLGQRHIIKVRYLNMNKKEIMAKVATNEKDTGSPEVQVALLTARIQHLTEQPWSAEDGWPSPQSAGLPAEERH